MARTTVPSPYRKAVGGNMVFNGDFEIAPVVNVATTTGGKWIDGTAGGSDIMIFGWAYYNWATSYAVKFDTSTSHSGSASLKLSTTNTASTVGVQINAQTASTHRANNIPMLPSTSYTFSCWVKTNVVSGAATTGARVQFMTRTGDGITNVTTTTLATNLLTTQDWTQYTATFTTGATVRFGTPSFQIVGNDGAGTLIMDAWFDDITLTKTTPETRTAISGPYRRPVTNMIPNSDFEYAPSFTAAAGTAARWIDGTASGSSATKGPYGWALSYVSGTVGASFDSTVSRSGTYSLKLSQLDTSSDVIVSQSKLSSTPTRWELNNQLQAALPSTSYTLTLWAKTNNVVANGVYADIREFNGAGSAIVTSPTAKLSGTNDWTRLSLTLTTNSSTRFIGIMLRNTVGGNVCDAWFDDITLDLTSNTSRSVA